MKCRRDIQGVTSRQYTKAVRGAHPQPPEGYLIRIVGGPAPKKCTWDDWERAGQVTWRAVFHGCEGTNGGVSVGVAQTYRDALNLARRDAGVPALKTKPPAKTAPEHRPEQTALPFFDGCSAEFLEARAVELEKAAEVHRNAAAALRQVEAYAGPR